jgi:hypothetical protein
MEPVSIKRRRTELDHSHESQKFTVKIEPSLPQPINNGFIKIEPLFNEVKNTGDLVIKLEPQSLGYGDNEIASSVLDNTNDRIVKTEFDDEIYGISEDLNIRKGYKIVCGIIHVHETAMIMQRGACSSHGRSWVQVPKRLKNLYYALIRSSTEHKLFMYLTSSIIIKRHKHHIFWDQLARRAANNLLIKYKYSPYKHHT